MRDNKTAHNVFSAVVLTIAILCLLLLATYNYVWGQTTTTALDPGPRVGGVTTGNPLATLTPTQLLTSRMDSPVSWPWDVPRIKVAVKSTKVSPRKSQLLREAHFHPKEVLDGQRYVGNAGHEAALNTPPDCRG
jgi:hypothetical protein